MTTHNVISDLRDLVPHISGCIQHEGKGPAVAMGTGVVGQVTPRAVGPTQRH